jgi:hypothetical protein
MRTRISFLPRKHGVKPLRLPLRKAKQFRQIVDHLTGNRCELCCECIGITEFAAPSRECDNTSLCKK